MHRASVIKTILHGQSETSGTFAPELLGIDRILQRWAVSVMGGMPTDVWDESPVSKPPPLDEAAAEVMDRIILNAPPKQRKVINLWYQKPLPTRMIAQRMGVSSNGIYLLMNASLGYVRDAILHKDQKNKTLKELAKPPRW